MVETVLKSISTSIGRIGLENRQFKMAATQQNSSISRFIKDISKMFSSQSKQQSDIGQSLNELQQSSVTTNQKVDQTNDLMQESISVQTQMLNELKNVSSSIYRLLDLAGGGNGGGNNVLASLGAVAGGAALGAGVTAAVGSMESGAGSLTGILGGQVGYKDTGGGGSKLSVAQMAELAKEAGFNDEQAAIMAAIGAAESSGNTKAHNPNASTGDDSYGLWQINMLGNLGPERRNQFGISENQQLFDPRVNAAAAKKIFDQQGFEAWSVYKSGAYAPYLGTAREAVFEKDDSMAPPGTIQSNSEVMGSQGQTAAAAAAVIENQRSLAGIRKLPLSQKLRSVLDQAAAAAGVQAVVYSGGQSPAGSGGPRTGSTRHDNGNAADLYLMKGGKKLSDTNPEDRAIMAKFVSAAVAAGATGVGAGHGYMGPSNIHVGFGKQATWGGAPWIQAAASGVYNNQDLTSESGGYGSTSNYSSGSGTGIESVDNALASLQNTFAGTPLAGMSAGITGALGTLAGGAGQLGTLFSMGPATGGLLAGGSIANFLTNNTGTTNLFDNIFRPPGSEMAPGTGPYGPNRDDRNEVERYQYNNEENPEGDDLINSLKNMSKEPAAINSIQNAALESDSTRFMSARTVTEPQQTNPKESIVPNQDLQRGGYPTASQYSSSPSWYLQLAGRINNDSTMKFKGGVFA